MFLTPHRRASYALCAWVVKNLPDSISARKELLSSVLDVLEPAHPLRRDVSTALTLLISHERAQMELFPALEAEAQGAFFNLGRGNNKQKGQFNS